MRPLSPSTAGKLFTAGFTVGPIVDSLHNQCLLKYDVLPISLQWPSALTEFSDYPYFFCSSWAVPPLLGIAYVVLGGILPRFFEIVLNQIPSSKRKTGSDVDQPSGVGALSPSSRTIQLRQRAILAVASTALIIKLSEFLETTRPTVVTDFAAVSSSASHLAVMLVGAIAQWALLDGSIAALLAASITSIGGPLSELPFVANGFWEYLDSAANYFPLMDVPRDIPILKSILGNNYAELGLSSITGPCYFAVAMDAIALGRWFDSDPISGKENNRRIDNIQA
eukprot:scaffold674_cov126-Cylindrotheca_fusiformis.AAC.15